MKYTPTTYCGLVLSAYAPSEPWRKARVMIREATACDRMIMQSAKMALARWQWEPTPWRIRRG